MSINGQWRSIKNIHKINFKSSKNKLNEHTVEQKSLQYFFNMTIKLYNKIEKKLKCNSFNKNQHLGYEVP